VDLFGLSRPEKIQLLTVDWVNEDHRKKTKITQPLFFLNKGWRENLLKHTSTKIIFLNIYLESQRSSYNNNNFRFFTNLEENKKTC